MVELASFSINGYNAVGARHSCPAPPDKALSIFRLTKSHRHKRHGLTVITSRAASSRLVQRDENDHPLMPANRR